MSIPIDLLVQHSDIIRIDGEEVTYVGIVEAKYQHKTTTLLRFISYGLIRPSYYTPYVDEVDLNEKGEVFLLTSKDPATFTDPFMDEPTNSLIQFYQTVPVSEGSVLMATLGIR